MSFEGEVPTAYAHGPSHAIATWRNVLLILWSGPITSDALDATERAGKMLEKRYQGDQVAVSISLPKVPIPDDKVRAHAARLLREREKLVKLSVTVIEGDGFWLSAGRMVMTALVALSGSRARAVVAKSVEEACGLVQPLVRPQATLAETTRALTAFRG